MSSSDGEKREESKNNIRNTKKHQKTPKNINNTKKHKKIRKTLTEGPMTVEFK